MDPLVARVTGGLAAIAKAPTKGCRLGTGARSRALGDEPVARLLAHYRPPPGVSDELLDPAGRIRPVWRPFIEHLARLTPDELARRFARGDQYLRDAGVFFRQYGAAGPSERAWPLAHVPVLIEEEEAARIARGLVQRADLLEALVADLYGANRLVADGHLPAQPDRRQPRVAAAAGRRRAARRPLSALPRLRDRPRPGRHLVGARRPHPGALGRRLRAGEPRRDRARLLRPLRRGARPPAGRLLPHLPRRAAGALATTATPASRS